MTINSYDIIKSIIFHMVKKLEIANILAVSMKLLKKICSLYIVMYPKYNDCLNLLENNVVIAISIKICSMKLL
jgi:hypothetical protein